MSTFSEEVMRRENIRTGVLNRITYAATEKLPKKEVIFIQEIYTEKLEKVTDKYLFYVHDHNVPVVPYEPEAHNIFYNPHIAKYSIICILIVIVVVMIVAIRFS